ncbi:MAG: DUF4230 domain-containing protein [Spirochaetia bacterium]
MSTPDKGRKGRKNSPSRKRRHLFPLWLRLSILGLVATALLISAAVTIFPMLGISLELPFTSRTRISESEILLQEVRPLFHLSTVEYTYKSVFPHDFIPENSDPQRAYTRRQQGEELTSRAKEAADLYSVCRTAGIRLDNRSTEFVVLTSRVKGGYNLEPNLKPNMKASADLQVHLNPSLKTVELRLPEPLITEFVIQDETSEHYQYPDIQVDAAQWRAISGYVEEKIRSRVLQEGILEQTEKNMQDLLLRLMESAGWEQIVFTTASDTLQ